MKPSAQSNEHNLHGGTVIASFGVRYKSYCSNIGRTILINPEKVSLKLIKLGKRRELYFSALTPEACLFFAEAKHGLQLNLQ